MILLVHLLFGTAIGQKASNPFLAVILAFLSHYFLDIFPHIEYPIKNIKSNNWKKSAPDILRVVLDFSVGILFIFLFSNNKPIVYVCAFFAVLPDALTILNSFFPGKILEAHNKFHEKIHFLKNKKISNFWRVASQVAAILVSFIMIKY
jgi:hypothetical protein